jgi:hypothetical protein
LLETRFDRVRARVRRAAAAAANETATALQHSSTLASTTVMMTGSSANGTAQQPQPPLYTPSSSSSSRRPSWFGGAPLPTADGTRGHAADNAAAPVPSSISLASNSNARTSGASLSSSSPPLPSSSPQPQLQPQPQSPALHSPFDTAAVDWPQRLSALIRERDLMAVEKGGLYSTVEVMNLLVFGALRVLHLRRCLLIDSLLDCILCNKSLFWFSVLLIY